MASSRHGVLRLPVDLERLSPEVALSNPNIPFSYYRFLEVKEISKLSPGDVKYLEMKGCLHVPSGKHLDDFVSQYFLRVHPFMPILDEGDFWHAYSRKLDLSARSPKVSLLVFQAMLFAACAVSVPMAFHS